ncbi:3-phosphoinositide-dependent protein kinase 1-related [Anaeramoeba flamelloides]|uniref:non-specific serine/threonine protein kinase n=1 Tax=Anaeramoeba flamelloides TaxID=1746091 RepID=A0ABQ8XGB9_9EUKA|nr:3-phosphoinositide-dependent protein kinase 1-related [Anaeramoeba flamelloides]
MKKTRANFEFGKAIGRGRYGEVRQATEKKNGEHYAIKILKKEQVTLLKQEMHVKNEKEIMNKIDHPHIVKLFETFQDNESLYFVMELCPKGELLDAITKLGSLDYEPTRFLIAQLILVLEYLYSQSIVHRDIKPENILFTESGHIKLCDFGTAKIIEEKETKTKKVSSKTYKTSEGYVSPETLKDNVAMHETDLWSLGCLIYHMFYGKPPFRSSNEFKVFQKVLKREFRFPKKFPEQARDLVDKLLVINPEERIGAKGDFESLKSHPFFDGIDFNNLLEAEPPFLQAYPPTYDSAQKKKFKKQRKNNSKYTGGKREEEKKRLQKQILKEEEVYKGIDPNRVNLLKEQKKRSKWANFLEINELIIEMGLVYKKKGLFPRKRQFLLTDKPRFLYMDPKKGVKKGEITWSDEIKIVIVNKKKFNIVTKKRTYFLEDLTQNPGKWEKAVEKIKNSKNSKININENENKNKNESKNENENDNDKEILEEN